MNDCQRRQIEDMRKQGMGYKAIARKTKLSRDSVRNYCRWHHLAGYGRYDIIVRVSGVRSLSEI